MLSPHAEKWGDASPRPPPIDARAHVIREHHLTREPVSTRLLYSPPIWEALLDHMPMTAMVRSLDKMSTIGMLTPDSDHERTITIRLGDIVVLKNATHSPYWWLFSRTDGGKEEKVISLGRQTQPS